ncbi:phosphonate C-P lyase system protein PhnG [Sciscionella sediminilitoris]|uniref:phosphonate C-P lyase system protein PhnG n=1 Tax=Sciscionella sediminilitoris TaxID=1445613 RepID=UPI0004DF32DC|nr:phosphonate C-P lyase system protein PhnG [Sciscionella sp. SE31]
MNRERRCALLAAAHPEELAEAAEDCLAGHPEPNVLRSPEVGCVSVQVREPVVRERFLLGDVLACRAEVEFGGHRGWALRLGEDRAATLAAAILDAASQGSQENRVRVLCDQIAERVAAEEAAEWDVLAPTVVEFEELT